MIFEFLISAIFGCLEVILSPIPDITWDVSSTVFQSFLEVVSCVLYMLPMGTIFTIASLSVAFGIFRIIIALGKTVWDLLPIV